MLAHLRRERSVRRRRQRTPNKIQRNFSQAAFDWDQFVSAALQRNIPMERTAYWD
jgi:hypothetical protein